MKISHQASGFSAVELLITLFVGFLFITMGYQLYTVTAQVGGEAREQSKASDIAYNRLRALEANASTTVACPGSGATLDAAVPVDTSRATMTTVISCPITSMPQLKRIIVKVKYNVSQKEVTHGMYIYRP